MHLKSIFIFITTLIFLWLLVFSIELCSRKLRAELTLDMAKMGFYQKEVNGKVLWVKDKK